MTLYQGPRAFNSSPSLILSSNVKMAIIRNWWPVGYVNTGRRRGGGVARYILTFRSGYNLYQHRPQKTFIKPSPSSLQHPDITRSGHRDYL